MVKFVLLMCLKHSLRILNMLSMCDDIQVIISYILYSNKFISVIISLITLLLLTHSSSMMCFI